MSSARSAFASGEVATPGTRPRYSRPPGTVKNLETVPARLGAVAAEPVPSGRWQPWQLRVQFCQALCTFVTPAGAAAPGASATDAAPGASATDAAPGTLPGGVWAGAAPMMATRHATANT